MLERSNRQIAHRADHVGSLMIECIDLGELHFNKFLLSFRKAWVVYDKDLCFFSFLGLITIFYSIEADTWLDPKGFYPLAESCR